MRITLLSAAVALALVASPQAHAADAELDALKQQLAELQSKVLELEARTEAQSDVNIDTAQALDKINTGSPKLETKGGIKVTSADGNFEAQIGGRIHFDAYAFDRDNVDTTGTTDFRRARLTLSGKAMGWDYKMEQDFTGGTTTEGFRDVFIARKAFGGKVTIGQFKPYRSMEELTSSNEITMMERPFSSASGLYNGRQFAQGVGYQFSNDVFTASGTVFNTRNAASPRNEGVGAAGRVTWAPINNETTTLHFGGSVSTENANKGTPNTVAAVAYAGRRGPSLTVATTTGASGDSVNVGALEAAASFGPMFVQAEYARATFERPLGDHDVDTFYVMGSFMLNGGHRPYKPAAGVFGAPKVAGKGLWELTARYDTIENQDINNLAANALTLGMNYYVNPNVRFMFNYTQGENELNGDETGQYALRTQLSF